MKRKPKHIAPKKGGFSRGGLLVTVCVALVVIIVAVGFFLRPNETVGLPKTSDGSASSVLLAEPSQAVNEEPETPSTAEPTPKPQMLPEMAELYAQNPDVIGWITIEGTAVNYPVMYTPEDEEKYLRRSFEGVYDMGGVPFVDKDCSLDPESDNLIIYGHNMNSGTMFHDLLYYKQESYWKEHPTLTFKTLYEERKYEILGAFPDRVYYRYEDVFKFYQFIDAETEEDFEEAISYYRANTPYDTGVEAVFGDRLITLVTCAYHHEHGRYVVVAREITE